jgi:beta-phosphoglucomutase
MEPANRFKAAIFDFDGVIANSIPLHFESYRRLFREEGVEFTFDDYRRLANGRPRDEVIRGVLGNGIEPARFRRLMGLKERYIFEILARDGLRPIPGSLELARALRKRGLRTAVASSSRTARRFLEAIVVEDPSLGRPIELFDFILEGDGVRAAKPDPEIYIAAARSLGLEPSECLAIEDAVSGVRAAKAAGMPVIAVTTTEERDALSESDGVFSSFAEIDPDRIAAGLIRQD